MAPILLDPGDQRGAFTGGKKVSQNKHFDAPTRHFHHSGHGLQPVGAGSGGSFAHRLCLYSQAIVLRNLNPLASWS